MASSRGKPGTAPGASLYDGGAIDVDELPGKERRQMAIGRQELREWINRCNQDSAIAVDDGGLTLIELAPDGSEIGSLEIGGIPEIETEAAR